MKNLVQAEFFHVGGRDATPESFLYELSERVADGLELAMQGLEPSFGIKTVLRFEDITGELTALVLRAKILTKVHAKIWKEFETAGRLRRWYLGRRNRRLTAKIDILKEGCKLRALLHLYKARESGHAIAVERYDHTFRFARKEELHELLDAAASSSSVWLFVFEPNDLLADKNKIVASAM